MRTSSLVSTVIFSGSATLSFSSTSFGFGWPQAELFPASRATKRQARAANRIQTADSKDEEFIRSKLWWPQTFAREQTIIILSLRSGQRQSTKSLGASAAI